MPPSTIERWKILRKIGEGGMSRVFEAEHTEIGRRVAIKIADQSKDMSSKFPSIVVQNT
jgi:serine/threonine protein kinase